MFFYKAIIIKIKYLLLLLKWLLPSICVLCKSSAVTFNNLCLLCLTELPWNKTACKQCGHPLSNNLLNAICGNCLTNPPPYAKTVALFRYQQPVAYLITALKFNKQLLNAQILGNLLAESIATIYANENKPDCIIPVPLHNKRLRDRGYNQALEIARPLAKKLNISLRYNLCERKKNTLPQASVSAKERYDNVSNAFVVLTKIEASHVAIVDDVVTTGNTVRELTRVLKKSGVKRVDIWCCAKTLLK